MPAASRLFTLPPDRYRRGVGLRLIAMLAISIMAVATKLAVARGANTIEVIVFRNIFALAPVVGWISFGSGLRSVRTDKPLAHATRSVLGLTAMFLAFRALVLLPLAEAVTIGFTAPLFATMLSATVLGERVGPHRWAAIAAGMAGVVIVMQPGHAAHDAGAVIAIVGALTTGFVTVTLRQIGATEPATTTVFWFTLAGATMTAPLLLFAGHAHDAATWALLVLIGITGGTYQLLATAALRHASVATIAPFDYTQLLWAALLGWIVLGTPPTVPTIAGGALIVAGGLYTLYRERQLRVGIAARIEPVI